MFTIADTYHARALGVSTNLDPRPIARLPTQPKWIETATEAEKALSHVNQCYHREIVAKGEVQQQVSRLKARLVRWQIWAGLITGVAIVLARMVLAL